MGRCGAVGSALQCGVQPGCVFGLKVCEVLLLLGCRWGKGVDVGFFCVCVLFSFFFFCLASGMLGSFLLHPKRSVTGGIFAPELWAAFPSFCRC